MCTTWSQDQWLKETAKEGSKYTLLGTYTNENGKQALTIAESDGDVRNVYSADGWSEEFLSYQFVPETEEWRENIPHDEQVVLAQEAMTKRGYTPTTPTQVETQTEAPKQATDDDAVRVQGKTLAEWAREGELNETRQEHVHPTPPEGRPVTEDEARAFANSLTTDEAVYALMFMVPDEDRPTDAVGAS